MCTMVCNVVIIRKLDGGKVFPTSQYVLSLKADVTDMSAKTRKRKTLILTNYFE